MSEGRQGLKKKKQWADVRTKEAMCIRNRKKVETNHKTKKQCKNGILLTVRMVQRPKTDSHDNPKLYVQSCLNGRKAKEKDEKPDLVF